MAKRKQKVVLIDTGIAIEYLRGNSLIINELNNVIDTKNLAISIVSIGELFYGMRKNEDRKTKEFINYCSRFLINKEICNKFVELQLGYRNDRIAIPDCFIAATAISNDVSLYTLNTKDFDYIKGIKLYKPTHPKI